MSKELTGIYTPYNEESYNAIPRELLTEHIFEVGADLGASQLASKHSDIFISMNKNRNYKGIDKVLRAKPLLEITECDLFDVYLRAIWDTVICIDVVEHITFDLWSNLFIALKSLVAVNGKLIITTPYNETPLSYYNRRERFNVVPDIQFYHFMFSITPELIRKYLPEAEISFFGKEGRFRMKKEKMLIVWRKTK